MKLSGFHIIFQLTYSVELKYQQFAIHFIEFMSINIFNAHRFKTQPFGCRYEKC